MSAFEIPLLRDVKYGHSVDDFSVENFLATPEGLRLRPALSPLFDIPFANSDVVIGFYLGNNDTIYLAKVSAVFLLTVFQIDVVEKTYKEIFSMRNVSREDPLSMCNCNDYEFWLISGKLYRLESETFTEIDFNKGDIKPKNIVDFAVMNSTMYLLSKEKGEVFYTSDFAEFKKWEAFTIISYSGKGVGLGVIKNNLCIFTENGMEVWYGQPSSDGLFPLTKRRELSLPFKLISKRTLENDGTNLLGAFHSFDGKFVIVSFDGQEMKVLDNSPLCKDRSIIKYMVSSMFNYNNNTYYILFFNLPKEEFKKTNISYCLHLKSGIWTLLKEQNANYHINIKSRVYCFFLGKKIQVCKTSRKGEITFTGAITTDYFPPYKPYVTEQLTFSYFYEGTSEMFVDMFVSYKRDFALEPDYRVTIFADEFEESREKIIKLNHNLFGVNSGLVHFKFEFKQCKSSFLLKRIYGKERV